MDLIVELTEEHGDKIIVNLAHMEYVTGRKFSEIHFASHYITVQESKEFILNLIRSVKTDQNNKEGVVDGN